MSVTVNPSIDDPIVTFTFEGELTPEDLLEATQQAAEMLETMGTFYALIDVREVKITVDEVVALSNWTIDPRIHVVFVGHFISPASSNNIEASIYSSSDEALEHIRRKIAGDAPGTSDN